MSDDNLHPSFKATLDKFCSDTARLVADVRRKPDPAALAAAFTTAAVNFDVSAKVVGSNPAPASSFLSDGMLKSARELASWHEDQGHTGSAVTIRHLVFEIENLREATMKASVVIINQALADKNLATLKASTLLIVAEKIAPVIDQEIENRKAGCNPEHSASLQSLSDELHAALRLVRA